MNHAPENATPNAMQIAMMIIRLINPRAIGKNRDDMAVMYFLALYSSNRTATRVEGVYQTVYKDCAFDGKRLPPAVAIQQSVAAWKVLQRFRRKNLS